MKFATFFLVLTLSLQAAAWISKGPSDKLYSFQFKMKGQTFQYSQNSDSYEEAFEKAARACYQHFKGGQRLSEDQGLDIIDVCANPRTT